MNERQVPRDKVANLDVERDDAPVRACDIAPPAVAHDAGDDEPILAAREELVSTRPRLESAAERRLSDGTTGGLIFAERHGNTRFTIEIYERSNGGARLVLRANEDGRVTNVLDVFRGSLVAIARSLLNRDDRATHQANRHQETKDHR